MKLKFYEEFKGGRINFGDAINGIIWNEVLPNVFDNNEDVVFVGIGTLINNYLYKWTSGSRIRIIFGTGVGYTNSPPQLDDSFIIYCLRGPLSAWKLGLPSELAITDPAILISKIVKSVSSKSYKTSYMPHFYNSGKGWEIACKELDIHYIDPSAPIENVLADINSSEVLLTEAMHGAIVADSLRVPWVPIVTADNISIEKWYDWTATVSLTDVRHKRMQTFYQPKQKVDYLTPLRKIKNSFETRKAVSDLRKILKTCKPYLSSDQTFDVLMSRLDEKLEDLKQDITARKFCLT